MALPSDKLHFANGLPSYSCSYCSSQARQTPDVMEFKTFILGPAKDFLPAGANPIGSFQTWNNAKVRAAVPYWHCRKLGQAYELP